MLPKFFQEIGGNTEDIVLMVFEQFRRAEYIPFKNKLIESVTTAYKYINLCVGGPHYLAFFHGPLIRFHVESPSALPWITHPVSGEYTGELLTRAPFAV